MKTFRKILIAMMFLSVSLMFIRFVTDVPPMTIFIFTALTFMGVVVESIINMKINLPWIIMWAFMTGTWCFITNEDLKNKQKAKDKEPTEVIYRT